jgi:diacylglycerol kinase (ATP)
VILNPQAGRGRGAKLKPRLVDALNRAGLRVELHETDGRGHAIELARQARGAGYDTVVAAGGDGTVSEVLNGIAQMTPAGAVVGRLAIMPVGSANDFADMAGCPSDVVAVAQAIAHGQTRRVDLGHATIHSAGAMIERYFDNNIGIGFEAWVTLESYKIRFLRGVPLYGLAALRALRNCPTPVMHTSWKTPNDEGQRCSQPTLLISVGNSRRTGGGFYLTPEARLDDGQLDVGIAAAVSRPRILWLLPQALRGKHTSHPAITMLRCSHLEVRAEQPVPIHVDGEVITPTLERVAITLEPGRLEIIVAPSHATRSTQ